MGRRLALRHPTHQPEIDRLDFAVHENRDSMRQPCIEFADRSELARALGGIGAESVAKQREQFALRILAQKKCVADSGIRAHNEAWQ